MILVLSDIFGDAFAQFLVDESDGLIDENTNQKIESTNDVETNYSR